MFNFLTKSLLFLSLCIFHSPLKGFDLLQDEVVFVKSLVDASTICNVVERFYSIEKPVQAKVLSIGVNDIYFIQAGNAKYVLRLSRAQKYFEMTPEEFLFELEWLEFLNRHEVAVAYPIRRVDGALCGLIPAPEGPRYATLFSFAEGSVDLNEEQAFLLGEGLAKLHLVSDGFTTTLPRKHFNAKELVSEPINRIRHFLGNDFQDECEMLEKMGSELVEEIAAIQVLEDGYGIISGDFHGFNQHFTEQNQLTMFDFEYCAYGYRIYDLATFRWSRGSDDLVLWQAFLKGYQNLRPLNDSELQSIDLFVKARHIWWMGCLVTLQEYHHQLDAKFWNAAFKRFQNMGVKNP